MSRKIKLSFKEKSETFGKSCLSAGKATEMLKLKPKVHKNAELYIHPMLVKNNFFIIAYFLKIQHVNVLKYIFLQLFINISRVLENLMDYKMLIKNGTCIPSETGLFHS